MYEKKFNQYFSFTGMILFVILILLYITYPLIGFFSALLLLLFSKTNIKEYYIYCFMIALGMGIVAFLYDPNYHPVGDVVIYYKKYFEFVEFDVGNVNHVFASFFYILIYFLKSFGLSPQFINFVFVFLFYYLYFTSIIMIFENENIDIRLLKYFIMLIFVIYPALLLLTSSRNLLSFMFVFHGIINFTYNKKVKGIICFLISISVHLVALYPILVYLISNNKKKRLPISKSGIFLLFVFLVLVFILLRNNSLFRYYLEAKSNTYIYGRFKYYSNIRDIIYLVTILRNYLIVLWMYLYIKSSGILKRIKLLNFSKVFSVTSIFLIFYRSIFFRLSHGIILFNVYNLIIYFAKVKSKKHKMIMILLLISMFTAEYHLYTFFTPASIGDSFFISLIMNWKEILSYRVHLP